MAGSLQSGRSRGVPNPRALGGRRGRRRTVGHRRPQAAHGAHGAATPRRHRPADRSADRDRWGDAPPPNAAVALRAHASRLRAVLPASGGAPRLRYRAPGYELDVAPDELDAAAFEQLVSEARQYAEIDDHGRAMRVLATARVWGRRRQSALSPHEFQSSP